MFKDNCNGCGLCADVCIRKCIAIQNGKASIVNPDNCFECEQCFAVCPNQAMQLNGFDCKDFTYANIDLKRTDNIIPMRRSIRQYLKEPLTR